MSGPVAVAWVEQARDRHGWFDVQAEGLTELCCRGCQDDWLAARPDALDPVAVGPGRRQVGQPGQPLGETDYGLWCAACGVLIHTGLQEPPCPADACPPLVVNRLPDPTGNAARRAGAGSSSPPGCPTSQERARERRGPRPLPARARWGTCAWCTRPGRGPARPLRPMAVVAAWYPTLCRHPACGYRSDPGEPVGLVSQLGPCCAACCTLPGPQQRGRRGVPANPEEVICA